MTGLAFIVGAVLIATGAVWWWRVGVSAERPASLLVVMGVLGIGVGLWPA
jgi:hypothetical protein